MREQFQAECACLVQLDFNVQVADDFLVGGAGPVLPVADDAVDDDPVVEEFRTDGHVEDVVAGGALLVVQPQVYRDVQFLQDVGKLAGHDFHDGAVEHGRVVHDTGCLVRQETAGNQQRKELFLDLVFGVEGILYARLGGRIEVRNFDAEGDARIPEFLGDADPAFHVAAGVDGRRVCDERADRCLGPVEGLDVEVAFHDVPAELDRTAVLDGEIPLGDVQGGEMVDTVGQGVVAVDGEEGSAGPDYHVDVAVAMSAQRVPGFLVDLDESGDGGVRPDMDPDCQFITLFPFGFDVVPHQVIRVDVDKPVGFLEGQQVGRVRVAGTVQRDMEFPFFRRIGVHVEQDGVERAGDRHASRTEDIAVESLPGAFRQVQGFHFVDVNAQVQGHVLEMVPVDAAPEPSLGAEPVAEGHVVEHQSAG